MSWSIEQLKRDWENIRDEKRGEDYVYSAPLRQLAERTLAAIAPETFRGGVDAVMGPDWWEANAETLRNNLKTKGHL